MTTLYFILILTQYNGFCSLPAPLVVHGGIMLSGGIDVFVTQDVCNKINIAGFLVQTGAIGTSELTGGDLFR